MSNNGQEKEYKTSVFVCFCNSCLAKVQHGEFLRGFCSTENNTEQSLFNNKWPPWWRSTKAFVLNRRINAPSPFPKRRREPSTKKVSTKPVYVFDDMPAMAQAVTQTTHLFVTKMYKMKNTDRNLRKYATINFAKETWEEKNSSH